MTAFTVEDIRLLEKTQSIKERMIDNLMAPGKELPVKPREIDSYVNLLESVERGILGKAKINVEDAGNQLKEGTKEALLEVLLSLHKGEGPVTVEGQVVGSEIPTYTPQGVELNKAVLIPKIDTISMADVIDE